MAADVSKGVLGRVCSIGTRGIFGGGTELYTELSGTGIEFMPKLTGVLGSVLRLYRTLPKASVGCLPSQYSRYTLVHTLPNTALERLHSVSKYESNASSAGGVGHAALSVKRLQSLCVAPHARRMTCRIGPIDQIDRLDNL